MINKIIKDPNKHVFFIVGVVGSGKTTLANHVRRMIKEKCLVQDDQAYSMVRSKHMLKTQSNLISCINASRHLNQKIIVVLHGFPNLTYDFTQNVDISWMFTSMENYTHEKLESMGVDPYYLDKLEKAWRNSCILGTKTRAYLTITLDEESGHIIHEYHRFKPIKNQER